MTTVYIPAPRGLKIKLSRARHQLRQLRRTFDRFLTANPCSWRREVNNEGTHHLYSLHYATGPDVVQIQADEAVHHLRSLLDHLITSVIEANGQDASMCQFPIWDTEPRTKKAIARFNAAIEGVPSWARQLIVDVQPYKAGNAAHSHPLWILSRLDNRFKHTSLHLFVLRIGAPNLPGVIRRPAPPGNSGDIFAEVPIGLDVEKDFEPHLFIDIAFQVTRLGIEGVGLDTLDEIYNFVRDQIIRKAIKGRLPPRL